ncbi:hypothetical protein V8C86DRAFT_2647363 [Haematococcus lacustris]
MDALPTTDPEVVHNCQADYDAAFRSASQDEVDSARFRLAWALVHSTDTGHVRRGLNLARAKLQDKAKMKASDVRDMSYLAAVARFRLGEYLAARTEIKELLREHPDCRQAEALQKLCDDCILRDGLLGVGVGLGATLLGIGLAVLFSSKK